MGAAGGGTCIAHQQPGWPSEQGRGMRVLSHLWQHSRGQAVGHGVPLCILSHDLHRAGWWHVADQPHRMCQQHRAGNCSPPKAGKEDPQLTGTMFGRRGPVSSGARSSAGRAGERAVAVMERHPGWVPGLAAQEDRRTSPLPSGQQQLLQRQGVACRPGVLAPLPHSPLEHLLLLLPQQAVPGSHLRSPSTAPCASGA